MNATALIAEDEPVLAHALSTLLGRLWPELRLLPLAQDGNQAVALAVAEQPDVLFLDIKMPGRDGLDAAEAIADAWPEHRPLPLTVFVTAYDEYALAAFEQAAVDYVLKPVQPERLASTCQRLAQRLAERQASTDAVALAPLTALLNIRPTEPALTMIQAGMGSTVHLVPVTDVHYFEAEDKYVRVVTAERALLIRTPLRELAPRLDATQFMQIHRGTVVRTTLIERVVREDTGRIHLFLKGRPERLSVSRSHAHLFKPM